VIADERDQQAVLAHQTVQAVAGAVRVGQGEGRCLPAEIADRGVQQHVFLHGCQLDIGIPATGLNPGVMFVNSLQRHRHAGAGRFLRRLTHAHRPDPVIQPDLDLPAALYHVKELQMLMVG
jgi:hypothetical protein